LGIKHGQDEESALRYRDKILMKKILKEAGIRVPECAPVESASDIVNFCEKHGFDVNHFLLPS
jgi:biotin carboxylase